MIHIYDGLCPDELQPDSRDPNCPACCVEAERDALRDENARLAAQIEAMSSEIADAKEEYNEEHAAACAMFELISSIAAMVGIEDSSAEISRKTIDGVKRLRDENARLRQILVDVCNATRGACTNDVSIDFLSNLPGEVKAEKARLESALTDAAAQLTDVVQRAQEAEYNLHLMTKQADAFHAENSQLRQQLEHQSAAYYLLRDECDEKVAKLEAELREVGKVVEAAEPIRDRLIAMRDGWLELGFGTDFVGLSKNLSNAIESIKVQP